MVVPALRAVMVVRLIGLGVAGALAVSCSDGSGADRESSAARPPQASPPTTFPFTDVSDAVGLAFVHVAGFDPQDPDYFMPESMAPGCALFDMEGDGDLDIYLVNGQYRGAAGECREPARNRLYRNDAMTFVDATGASGLGDTGCGMGVAVGDVDNDGDADVYVTNYGPDALYRNNGDGTFREVTTEAGIDNAAWAASAAFVDYDRDGWLDLLVANYLALDLSMAAKDASGRREYPGPHLFPGVVDKLYRNVGGGRFRDVTVEAGLGESNGRGLGVACADFNDDGWQELYVANDREANCLWINAGADAGGARFREEAVVRGAAYNVFGQPEASMGVAVGDADGDGRCDLFVTHLVGESNTLYGGGARGALQDVTARSGLGAASRAYTGFGAAMFDYDHDGDLDVLVVNGRVRRGVPHAGTVVDDHWRGYAEPNLLFENTGGGRFEDISASAGPLCGQVEVSRGLAAGDVDNDGDVDVLLANAGGCARLFRNDAVKKGSWLVIRVVDGSLMRDAIGAEVYVWIGERRVRRDVHRGFSYLSSGDARVHVGLGDAARAAHIDVHWPDGAWERFAGGDVNRSIELRKGDGVALDGATGSDRSDGG